MTPAQKERLLGIQDMTQQVAYKHAVSAQEYEELKSVAIHAAAQAVVRWDKRRKANPKARWEGYAYLTVAGAVRDYLRKNDWLTRKERREVKDNLKEDPYFEPPRNPVMSLEQPMGSVARLEDLIADANVQDADLAAQLSEDLDFLAAAIDCLPMNERHVLIGIYRKGMTQQEVAHLLGFSKSRVTQLKQMALLRLHDIFKGRDAPSPFGSLEDSPK